MLEHLQKIPVFASHVHVVTLPMDTEFYHQTGHYSLMEDATTFIQQFKQHLGDDSSGFFFPQGIKEIVFAGFTDRLFDSIHSYFFQSSKILTKEDRQNFISLFYLFLEMKLIEIAHPNSFCLTCKDGVDLGSYSTALFFMFFEMITSEILNEADLEYLNLILYGPSILIRERAILPDPFNRFISVLKKVEIIRQEKGFHHFVETLKNTFGPLFEKEMLSGRILIPSIPEEEKWKLAA